MITRDGDTVRFTDPGVTTDVPLETLRQALTVYDRTPPCPNTNGFAVAVGDDRRLVINKQQAWITTAPGEIIHTFRTKQLRKAIQ